KLYGSYHGTDIDSVNLASGHLEVTIPLISYPQRGGKLGLSFSARLKAAIWSEKIDCSTHPCTYLWQVNEIPPVWGDTGPPAGGPPVFQLSWDQAPPTVIKGQYRSYFYGPDKAQHPFVGTTSNYAETVDGTAMGFIFANAPTSWSFTTAYYPN